MNYPPRKSVTSIGHIYFWTATIHNWYPLLADDRLKEIIIASLKRLSDNGKVTIYAFVIMPDHIHLIWQQNRYNGKESPKASLLKFTAHQFLDYLKAQGIAGAFLVQAANKNHEIWQRDSLGIEIYSRWFALQKLNYIHQNPVQGRWLLAKDDISYYYSSSRFYETGHDDFGFLTNILFEFEG